MGLPRRDLAYQQTWVGLVRKALESQAEFITFQQSSLLSSVLVEQDFIQAYSPDCAVLQLGITECAPHPLGPLGKALLGGLRPVILRRALIGLIAVNYAKLAKQSKALASSEIYAENLRRFLTSCISSGTKALLISIGQVSGRVKEKNPRIVRAVDAYNAKARETSALFPSSTFLETCDLFDVANHALTDGYHWRPSAHELLAEAVALRLCQLADLRPLKTNE
jgi:hypothetical protein